VNLLTILALLVTLGAAPQASPTPMAAATPGDVTPAAVTATPSAAPAPSASPAASPPVMPVSGTPSPAPTTPADSYKYRFVPRQPDHPASGVPQIFAVYLNEHTLHSQGPIQIKVTTSSDVVKVVSQSGSHQGNIPEVVPGDFEAFSTLPKVPFIASGMTLFLEFVATGPTGEKTSVRVPVKLL
jgi:hypothetical protein